MGQPLATGMLIVGSLTFTVLANLALKVGAQRPSIGSFWPLNVINSHAIVGAGAFALAFLCYAMLLKRLPLSLAQAILSVQFVLVILAANVVLHESIGAARWIGIGLMALGLLVVGVSPEVTPATLSTEQLEE